MVTQVSITLLCHIQWNLSFGTPPFKRQLYSGDAKFDPGKIFTTCLYLLLLLKGLPLFRGKGHFFWVPKPEINFHSEGTLALKPQLTMKRVDELKFTLITMMTAVPT